MEELSECDVLQTTYGQTAVEEKSNKQTNN